MKSIDWASAIMFGAKRTNGWREERGAERSRLERMLERNDEPLIADLFWRHPTQSGSRSGPLACRPISGSRREERCAPGFAKHLLTCAAVIAARQTQDVSPNLITSGGELRAEPDRKGVVFRRCLADEKSWSFAQGANRALKEQQRTRSEIAQDIGIEKSASQSKKPQTGSPRRHRHAR